MLSLNFLFDHASPLHVLCLGAHSDDIEIGCGGTILRLQRDYPHCLFHWVVFSAAGVRAEEAKRSATRLVNGCLQEAPRLHSFQDGHLPFAGAEVKGIFEELKHSLSPDLIFSHNRKDAHQDHQLLAELTWNTFRDHLVLEYEIPKYDGDMGQPNVFVPLPADIAEKKVTVIMENFESQHSKRWFRPDTFLSLMRLRGMECNSASGYAEGFFSRKIVL